jgi:very-short-patch-repair endonuclease
VAATQRNLITTWQLRALKISKAGISRRVDNGRLHHRHRGVYVVGTGLLLPGARELSAVLAYGPKALLSHLSLGVLFGVLEEAGRDVDVTVPGSGRRDQEGIRAHRSVCLAPQDIGTYDGIPVTSPARMLLDIATLLPRRDLAWAYNEALVQDLTTPEEVAALLKGTTGHTAARALRAIVERDADPKQTKERLARLTLEALRRGRVHEPLTEQRLHGWSTDFHWPGHGLVLEADGFKFHKGPEAWRRDRRKDAELEAAGLRVLRTDWEEVTERPESLVARVVRAQLERSGSASPATAAATTAAPRKASRASTA